MNTRGGTIGTAAPRPTRHTPALHTAAGRRQWKGTIRTKGPSRNQRGTAADMRRHTPAHTRREPHTGRRLIGRRHGTPGTASPHRSPRRLASNQRLRDKPYTATTPGKPTMPGRAPCTTLRRTTTQHTPPTPVDGTRWREWHRAARLMQLALNKCRPALAALQPVLTRNNTNPTTPPNPNEFLPRVLGEGHAPRAPAIHQRQGKGRGPRHGPVLLPDPHLPQAGHEVHRTRGASQHAGCTGPPMTT